MFIESSSSVVELLEDVCMYYHKVNFNFIKALKVQKKLIERQTLLHSASCQKNRLKNEYLASHI